MVYDITEHCPQREHFGLAYQLRKSTHGLVRSLDPGALFFEILIPIPYTPIPARATVTVFSRAGRGRRFA
jgi:hypothetical protein